MQRLFAALRAVCLLAVAGLLAKAWLHVDIVAADDKPLPPAATRSIDFAKDVQPIFVRHCHGCHGSTKQESGYRLDVKAVAFQGGDLGESPIAPGKSAQSPLIQYVAGSDSAIVMPPKGDRLSAEQVGVLRAWIDQGAAWPKDVDGSELVGTLSTDHWSFQPVRRPAVPAVAAGEWVRNPIDAFILQNLQDAGLEPAAPADRVDLIRRLHLDLLGLLPTIDEVRAFQADSRPEAYERLVERVLASPRFGERWARHWFDVVRFAETDGFEMNQDRPNAWHYRDYVIRAFNDDKPYDQFVREQIAGDTFGVQAATGFLVGGSYDKVKSPDINLTLMQRQDELADMINTTGTTFLGLTLGCARCHNHKFDPVLQKDFYSVQAVFAGVQHGDRPLGVETTAQDRRAIEELQAQIASVGSRLQKLGVSPPVNPERNEEWFSPMRAKFVRLTVTATNTNSEPCIDELEIWTAADEQRKSNNVALASDGAGVTSSGDFAGNAFHKIEHLNDGRYGNSRSWISNERGRGWVQIELSDAVRIDRIVWGRDREGKYKDRLATEYRIEVAVQPGQWQLVAGSNRRLPTAGIGSPAAVNPAGDRSNADAEQAAKLLVELKSLEQRKNELELAAVSMVYAGRFTQPAETHRLYRGDPSQKREVVAPDALTILGTLGLRVDEPEQKRRTDFARSITNGDNPLTARVMVNRIWHYHFGSGIVATPSDFGANGSPPRHPELLDWLADEFVRGGWSMKRLHRLIVTSNTYRQSSRPNRQGLAVDADSRLLWRFPPRRLEAEIIRDNVLWLSGVLDLQMGGPGFSAFKPNSNYVRVYEPKEEFGPAEWRRMVYMFKVRMEQDSVFGSFDCPDAGQVAPRRSQSTTSIQALNLLNSQFMVQQSELLAERLRKEAGDSAEQQVQYAFRLAFGREPANAETAAAAALIQTHELPAFCRAILNANELLFLP